MLIFSVEHLLIIKTSEKDNLALSYKVKNVCLSSNNSTFLCMTAETFFRH